MIKNIPLLKRLYPFVRRQLAKIFWTGGYSVVSTGGSLFLLNYRNFIDREIAFYNSYEKKQISYFMQLMRKNGCDLFLDIGANFGFYSVHVGRQKLAKKIIAFEPDLRSVNTLKANLLMNNLIDQVQIIRKAVSNREDKIGFQYFPSTSTGQSHINEKNGKDFVDAITIDGHIQMRGRLIFIKIDVEGHELAVMEGMLELIRLNKIFLQIECYSEKINALSKMLEKQDFHQLTNIDNDHYFTNVKST